MKLYSSKHAIRYTTKARNTDKNYIQQEQNSMIFDEEPSISMPVPEKLSVSFTF